VKVRSGNSGHQNCLINDFVRMSVLRVGRVLVATSRCLLKSTGAYCDLSKYMVTCF
jgi:hypothetical protein